MTKDYGFIKVGAAVPKLKVADTLYNLDETKKLIMEAQKNNISMLVFPELSITSYTCGDLFGQDILIKAAEAAVDNLCQFSRDKNILLFVGAPVELEQYLFNCAIAILNGRIIGIVPKTFIPNYSEYYEKRWFSSGSEIAIDEVIFCGQKVPFGTDIIFQNSDIKEYCIGVEICEDLWAPIPPSSYAAICGATVLVNLSASNELVSKAAYRAELVKQQSGRLVAAYVYSSSGVHESTTDVVFSGHSIIAENGTIFEQSERFSRKSSITSTDIDLHRLCAERRKNITFKDSLKIYQRPMRRILFKQDIVECSNISRKIDPYPFVPLNEATRNERCQEIFNIQVAGLAKRLEHTGYSKAVIGVSGGLDSTLALLVIIKTFKVLGIQRDNIFAITMPGFGTTDRTYTNTIKLCKTLNTNLKEISIVEASLLHFKDINHDKSVLDVTYENVQARERTQILMDIANKEGGLVIGTGDLSELALGWSTYNGDHMSMYAVNCSIPKTLVRSLVHWAAENEVDTYTSEILIDILNTPVSPELLPADKSGKISQKTEDIIGPYELHDFFLYHMLKYGAPPKKVFYLAKYAFGDKYSGDEIKKWLKVFYRRFFSQQFKRSCIPDGPKVGTISLSPRGDWRMPSDASASLWLMELENDILI